MLDNYSWLNPAQTRYFGPKSRHIYAIINELKKSLNISC